MKILNNSKKYKCSYCGQNITTKRKAKYSVRRFYHLSCLFQYATRQMLYWRKIKNRLAKYKKDFILERL